MVFIYILLHFFHPLHVSVCEVNYNPDSKFFEFSQRIFLDDLELAINKQNNSHLDLTHPKDEIKLDSILSYYLNKRISFKVDDFPVSLTYLGHEVEEGVYWFYFESETVKKTFSEIRIKNTVLFELYEDQSTIVQIKLNDRSRSFRLTDNKTEVMIRDF